MSSSRRAHLVALVAMLFAGAAAHAQWDPVHAQWRKSDPNHLRVMQFNVHDGLRSQIPKTEGLNQWTALARIVASLRPDVILLEECADNNGVDTVANMQTVLNLFMDGGTDPFLGGPVTSYVKLYAPDYDLPTRIVGLVDDGFNRNCILARFPTADINGSGTAVDHNFLISAPAGAYWTSGTAEIRGIIIAEFDLPDAVYAGDLVCTCSHLKSGSDQASKDQRARVGPRIAAFLDAQYNGLGTGVPDPQGFVFSPGNPASILSPATPVIWGGDLNEDENTNGRRGPADYMAFGAGQGGNDGCDRDRTDATYDSAVDFFNGSRATQGSGKLDYLLWHDSIAALQRSFVFNTQTITGGGGQFPPELAGMPGGAALASGIASDHKPVIIDVAVPLVPPPPQCPADWDHNGVVNSTDVSNFINDWFTDQAGGTLVTDWDHNGVVNSTDVSQFINDFFAAPPECL
jgi:hypothetical protein